MNEKIGETFQENQSDKLGSTEYLFHDVPNVFGLWMHARISFYTTKHFLGNTPNNFGLGMHVKAISTLSSLI